MEAFIKFGTGVVGLTALILGVIALNKVVPTQVVTQPQAGSVTGPDAYYDYFNTNGTYTYYRTVPLIAATTTPCVIKSPNATTTLDRFVFNVTTATSSAATLTLATSTVPNATTSLIASLSLSAGAQGTPNWAPGVNNGLVAPNTYVSMGASGVSQGGYTFGGSCNAVFIGVTPRN